MALAVAMNPTQSFRPINRKTGKEWYFEKELPSQIQLCPWFVDWVKNHDYRVQADVARRAKIGRRVIELTENNFGLRQIGMVPKSSYEALTY